MLSLQDYVSQSIKGIPYNKEDIKYNYPKGNCKTFESFLIENNVTEENVTEDMINWFCKHVCEENNYYEHPCSKDRHINKYQISEMLNHTPSIQKLINRLNIELGGNSQYSIFRMKETDKIEIKDKDIFPIFVPKKMYDLEKIEQIADSMLYFCTKVWDKYSDDGFANPYSENFNIRFENSNGIEFTIMVFEPTKAEKCTDYIKNECKGIIYHVTKTSNLNNILQTGLRMKGSKGDWRFIKNKVYFIASTDNQKLKDSIEEILKFLKTENYSILQINVNNYNVDFYRDLMYDDLYNKECFVYSYAYFPSKIIKDVTKELKDTLSL